MNLMNVNLDGYIFVMIMRDERPHHSLFSVGRTNDDNFYRSIIVFVISFFFCLKV
jgi:hypothetical protein